MSQRKLYYDYHYNRKVKERGARTEQVSLSDELVAHIADDRKDALRNRTAKHMHRM